MKKQVNILDATPKKRFILSIVSDYDLTRAICELIDNAIDIWVKGGKKRKLIINLDFDDSQKTIKIRDNADGIPEQDLEVLIAPGATTNKPDDSTIGIFGVGTKRAVIALAEDIKIKTRFKRKKTFAIELDESWLNDENWTLPYSLVNNINENSTLIELQKLRIKIDANELQYLMIKLSEIYARFLTSNKLSIKLNSQKIGPRKFDNWAYPPNYEPRRYRGNIKTQEGRNVKVEVIAGLTQESSPTKGEYGVYCYCNDRLIVSGLKTPDVGFVKGIAGLPDASLSIARIIISFKGEARDMPWNSSKSNINTNHYIFNAFRFWLLDIVKNYSQLSRRLKGDWPKSVFKYKTGKIKNIKVPNFTLPNKAYLVELPPGHVRYIDEVRQKNITIEKSKPWTKGLYEGVVAVDYISRQKFETKDRISLILLDSTLEIAIKEYLVRDSGKYYSDSDLQKLFSRRHLVIAEIRNYINESDVSTEEWKRLGYYYDLRCKFVHERATVNVTQTQLADQRNLVQKVLRHLFKLKF